MTNQHRFYRYTTFNFSLQLVLIYNQLVSIKANFQLVQTLFGIRRKTRRIFARKRRRWLLCSQYFGHFQSNHRIARVSKGSNKKSFAIKVFHFCYLKLQQLFSLKEELNIFQNEIESLLDSSREFFKAFDQANKVS